MLRSVPQRPHGIGMRSTAGASTRTVPRHQKSQNYQRPSEPCGIFSPTLRNVGGVRASLEAPLKLNAQGTKPQSRRAKHCPSGIPADYKMAGK